jgi:hypothetical protein
MSAICPTCKSSLSCGCQKRVASNGVHVCTLCVAKYEKELLAKKAIPHGPPTTNFNINTIHNPPK